MDPDVLCQKALELKSKAEVHLAAGRFAEASGCATQAIELLERAFGSPVIFDGVMVVSDSTSADPSFWSQLAFAYDCRAKCLRHQGQAEQAFEDSRRALILLRLHASSAHDLDDGVAVVLHNMGNALLQMQSDAELGLALEAYTEAIELRQRLKDAPGGGHVLDDLAGSLKARATVQMMRARLGLKGFDLAAADRDLLEALRLRTHLVEVDGQRHLLPALAMTRYTLGDLFGMGFFFGPACEHIEAAIEMMRGVIAARQSQRRWELAMCLSARTLYGIGAMETGARQEWPVPEALECSEIFSELLEEGRFDQIGPYLEFVAQRGLPCLFKAGEVARAAELLLAALGWLRRLPLGPGAPKLAGQILGVLPPVVLQALESIEPRIRAVRAELGT